MQWSGFSFLRWLAKTRDGIVNPFQECHAWEYLQHLKESCAPATRADSFMSSLRFAFYVLGFDSLESAVKSRRLAGASEIMLAGKRLLRQASVLTVNQVKGLHAALMNENLHIMDRTVVAFILFSLYGRCRNSDLMSIHSFSPDFDAEGGFVTIETCNHKSGRMASLKTRLLPILVPARGVTGDVWVDHAIKIFHEAGIPLENPIDGPLLPAPSGDAGCFMERGLRSQETSSMLRRFIGVDDPAVGQTEPTVSSHSLKATTLAWAARFGLSPSSRSLLGRHSSSLHETFAIYSRDLMVGPVMELQAMLDEIAKGEFLPDEPRSGFFKRKPQFDSAPRDKEPDVDECSAKNFDDRCSVKSCHSFVELIEPHFDTVDGNLPECDVSGDAGVPSDVVSDDSSGSSSDDSGMSSDDSEMVEPPARVKRFRARIPLEEKWYVHCKSHLVHRFNGETHGDISFLVCGKRLNDSYSLCTEASAWNVLCKSCNKR